MARPERPRPPLVDCLLEDHRWEAVGLEALAETACAAALRGAGLDPSGFEISLLGCSDARIADLNADFRGKPKPTNVLSWPSDERGAAAPGSRPSPPRRDPMGPTELGDIAIAYETCRAEAEAAGRSLADHASHLLVHGTLHLLGFDHETDADAALMEGLETETLGKMGIADPYAAHAIAAPEGDDGRRV
ncbi:putative rRNA maturation factor [Limimaricola variabilis]|uniref:Endoribonuclease YbeY n=1 Tax=Limimaricola variabilis TaxID=1492771 RepID=A0ABR6HNZ1_9RHOB|nr:rRNA maturation RNase YbeY [Limimaricola variabilis]MBB3712276.1 putative rRNA maturation factor [Limimaricola variabilis]